MIYEDKVEPRDPMTPKKSNSAHVFPRRTKKRTNIDWSVHCVRSVLSSLSKGGNHLEKVTSINSDTVHQLRFFFGFDGVPKF